MNRRSFLKSIGCVMVLPIVVTKQVKRQELPTVVGVDKAAGKDWTVGMMDFSPDEVIEFKNYRGRLLVFCKHSVWEIEENCYGDGLQRKLLRNIGRSSCPDSIVEI